MITSLGEADVHMSFKIHLLQDHLDYFPENCGLSDEQGEKFHQDVKVMEKRYKTQTRIDSKERMLGDYCWSICRSADDENDPYQHKKNGKRYFVVRNF